MKTLLFPIVRGLAALVLAGALVAPASAQTSIRIQQLNVTASQVRLVVSHPSGSSTNFGLQISRLTNGWTIVPGASVRSLGSGQIELLAPRPPDAVGFYRIFGILDPNDTDGDGLPNSVEVILGTSPIKRDTDDDGYDDGVEVAYGTDPLDPNSYPGLTTLPRAEFVDASSIADESASPHVVRVQFNRPFFGTLKYRVLPESTATAPANFQPLSGSVAVAGTTAAIAISWVNDTNISPFRAVFLQITNGPADGYARGGRTRHSILLQDSDSWWNGVLKDKYTERNFRVKLVRDASSTQAFFAAGGGQDGLPVLASEPANARSSQSEGVIPVGTWPATVPFDTTNHFKIVSPLLPASTGGLVGGGTGLRRTLALESWPPPGGPGNSHQIIPGRYLGTYTEVLTLPGATYLACTNTGVFVLMRDLPVAPNFGQ